MYNRSELAKFPFFKKIENVNYIDSLTHTVIKEHITGYVKSLIEENKPFAVAKLNVDNFRLINDNYGHHVGDIILSKIGEILVDAIEEKGIVGRLDGDEFLIVFLYEQTYESVWKSLKTLFDERLRNKIDIATALNFKVSITAGAAIYPTDAQTYENLVLCVQRALVRGKSKGRNCFIVYVEEKHKNISIMKNSDAVLDDMAEIHARFTKKGDKSKRISCAMGYLVSTMSLAGAYYFKNDGTKILSDPCELDIDKIDLEIFNNLFNQSGMIVANNYSDFKTKNPKIHEFCWKNKIYAFVLQEVSYNGECFGYVLFCDSIIKRIWQEKDKTIISFIAKSISYIEKE